MKDRLADWLYDHTRWTHFDCDWIADFLLYFVVALTFVFVATVALAVQIPGFV